MGAEERGGSVLHAVAPPSGNSGSMNGLGLTDPAGSDLEAQPPSTPLVEKGPLPVDVSYSDIAKQFSLLGWTAFGGPSAHIGLFEKVTTYSDCCT